MLDEEEDELSGESVSADHEELDDTALQDEVVEVVAGAGVGVVVGDGAC